MAKRAPWHPRELWAVLKSTVKAYVDDDTTTLGAALAYYTVFSLAPILFLAVAAGGLLFDSSALAAGLRDQMSELVGESGAKQVESMIAGAWNPGKGTLATVIAAGLLVFGATAVFGQLRSSLNYIWEIKPKPHAGYVKKILERVFSFAMVVVIAFLLLVSLAIHAGLASAYGWLGKSMGETSRILLWSIETAVSLGITVLLFWVVFKFLSEARVRWRDAFAGAVFTAVLFSVGRHAIGAYLARSSVTDTFGVASSLVLLLLWVYYSSQILFLGAEFTWAWASARGSSILPTEHSVRKVDVEVEKPHVGKPERRKRAKPVRHPRSRPA